MPRKRERLTPAVACAAMLVCGAVRGQVPGGPPDDGTLAKLSLQELMNIEVTSVSRQPRKLIDAPSAVQVVTHDDIQRSGAESIPQALRLADNLDVAQKNAHDWGISARGFNTELANKMLVMIDGRTVYTPLFSGVIWDAQDVLLEDVERIEVVSGPGGSLWGANAVNGVVSIISRSAKETQGLYAEGGFGNVLHGAAAVRFGGKLGSDTYYRIYGKHLDQGHEVLPGGGPAADSWSNSQGGFRIDSGSTGRSFFTLQGDAYHGQEEMPAGGTDTTSGRNVLLRWSRSQSAGSGFDLQLYYDHTHLAQPAPPLVLNGRTFAPAGRFQDELDTYDADFQQHLPAGSRNHLIWGLGYRHTRDSATNAPSIGFLPARLDHDLFSAFLQDEIDLSKEVLLTIGSKVEHNDYTGLEIEPSVRLKWDLSSMQHVWAAASRAVRVPSRIDHDLSEGTPPFFVLLAGGRDFVPERIIAYEAGWRATIGRRGDVAVSLFDNDYSDIRSTGLTPVTVFPFVFRNDLEGWGHGAELSGNYQAGGRWRLHAGYSVLREHLQVRPGGSDLNNALNEVSDPEQHASLRSSMDLPRHVTTELMLRWVDRRPGHNGPVSGVLPGYMELDARLAWQATEQLALAVTGQNLLHDQHAEYGFPTAVRAEIRRSVVVKAVVRR